MPFLIVDVNQAPCVLNHEVEHGIEFMLKVYKNNLFSELGALFLEQKFMDTYYDSNGLIYSNFYNGRLEDTSYYLSFLRDFLNMMKAFARTDFKVSDEEFKTIFLENANITDNNIDSYLLEEDVKGDIEEYLKYLLSFLKAIELRSTTKKINCDKFDFIRPYLIVNDTIRMYKKWNIKMLIFVHSFCYTY